MSFSPFPPSLPSLLLSQSTAALVLPYPYYFHDMCGGIDIVDGCMDVCIVFYLTIVLYHTGGAL